MGRFLIGEALFDTRLREIRCARRSVRLEPKAAGVLMALIERGSRGCSRGELFDRCWPEGGGSDESLTQVIAQLRRALGDDPKIPQFIQTVPRWGYKLIVDSKPAPDYADASGDRLAGKVGWPGSATIMDDHRFPAALLGTGLVLTVLVLALYFGGNHTIRHFIRHNFLSGPPSQAVEHGF